MNEQNRYTLTKQALEYATSQAEKGEWTKEKAFDWLEKTFARMGSPETEQFDLFVSFGMMTCHI